ncbi:MAG: hypothetical protein WAK26_19190 [Terracidiphilus sp.]|jgi:hypothetical protein
MILVHGSWLAVVALDGIEYRPTLPQQASPAQCSRNSNLQLGRPAMQDLVMLLFTVVFFAVAFLYVKACQKLR